MAAVPVVVGLVERGATGDVRAWNDSDDPDSTKEKLLNVSTF